MRCYYHEDQEAVGTCKSCGKGVCRDCGVELGKGLACRGRCEADARALIQLIERNIQLSGATANLIRTGRSVRSSTALFQFAFGAIFIAWGMTDLSRFKFLIVLGVVLITYGGYLMAVARKTPKN